MTPALQRRSESIKFREDRSAQLVKFASEAAAQHPQMSVEALNRTTEYLEVLKPANVPTLAQQAIAVYQQLGKPIPLCYKLVERAMSGAVFTPAGAPGASQSYFAPAVG